MTGSSFSGLRVDRRMSFIITAHKESLLRISDGEGSYITLRIEGTEAYILQIAVPPAKRRQGIATGLLSAAEYVLGTGPVTRLCVDYLESIDGMSGFLKARGFEISEGSSVLSVDGKLILNNATFDRLMSRKVQDAKTVRLREFSIPLWLRLREFLEDAGVELTCLDMAHMHQELSSAVFDKTGMIRSVMLGSASGSTAHAQLLLTCPGEDNQIYTLAAIQNMMLALRDSDGGFIYDRLLLTTYSHGVRSGLAHIAQKGMKPAHADECLYAAKNINSDAQRTDIEVVTMEEEGSESDWIRELSGIPMQRNISWKAVWYRKHQKN